MNKCVIGGDGDVWLRCTGITAHLIIALVVFGPGKLPTIGRALGKSLREFKEAVNTGETKEIADKTDEKSSKNV